MSELSLIPPPTGLPPGSIVDAYLRDSGGPLQDRSVEQQRNEVRDYCRQYGLQLREIYADIHKTGGTDKRNHFEEMIASTGSPAMRPAGLLIWNFARFARNVYDSQLYKAVLRKRGLVIHSLTDQIPEGPFSSVIETLIDTSNELKKQEAAYGAWRGLRHVVRQGAAPGTPPRGMMTEPLTVTSELGIERQVHRWVPNPDFIPLIRQAFRLKAGGATLTQIHEATHLFTSVNSYRTFFSNSIYIGILEFGDLVIENYCEAIIDMDTWNAVQARLSSSSKPRENKDHPRRVNSPYLLSGLVYCARCESPMHGNTVSSIARKKRGENYRCSRAKRRRDCDLPMINRRILEDAVLETLRDFILQPEALVAMHAMALRSTESILQEKEKRRLLFQKQKRALYRQIVNITGAIADGGHSKALLDKLSALEQETGRISNEIAALDIPVEAIPTYTDEQLERAALNLLDVLKHAPPEKIRTMLRGLIHRIVIDKNEHGLVGMITYYYPPPFEGPPADKIRQGGGMSIESVSSGPPLYRHTFSHPIIFKEKPHSA